ncbi:MAG: alkaline phosphatase D family protein [Gemmatimonadota bacterium]
MKSCRNALLLLLALAALAGPSFAQKTVIAFGSCNRQDLPQPLWPVIARHDPQLFIWLGDNIYGDTDDMRVMRRKYERQLANASYRAFTSRVPIVGTWDDHDYGKNDGGREYVARRASQQLMLDFVGEPAGSARRRQQGVYAAETYGEPGRRIKVILLDTRYHRDAIGSNGTVLGEEQWQWLEDQLEDSDAQIHLIASSIQVVPEDHRFEKWANFPAERERLLELIDETDAPGVIFLSGDRHIAELSRLAGSPAGYPLYDLTSSGLTHTWRDARAEANRHRVGDLIIALNYGIIEVDWSRPDPLITLRVRDDEDRIRIEQHIPLSQLTPED